MNNKFCIFCGKELEPGANFCYYCGQAADQEEPLTEATAPLYAQAKDVAAQIAADWQTPKPSAAQVPEVASQTPNPAAGQIPEAAPQTPKPAAAQVPEADLQTPAPEQESVANNDPTRLFTRQELMQVLAQSEDVGEDPLLASLPDAEPNAFTAVPSTGGYEARDVLPKGAVPYEEPVSYGQPANQEPSTYYQEPISYGEAMDYEEAKHPKRRSKAPLFALIGVVVLALAFGAFWFVSLRTIEVDLTGNMSVDAIAFEGKDGSGTAKVDRAAAQEAIDAKSGRAEAFVHQVNFELDKESGLSNGDTVTVTATYPYGLDEKKHLAVVHTTKTFKVSGLEDVAAKPKEEEKEKDKENGNPMDYNMANGEYYFDTVKLTEEHLKGKTDAQLQEAINYICAMNGRKFRDESWNNRFSAFSWYDPKYGADEFDGNIKGHMSDTEYYNYQMLIDAR